MAAFSAIRCNALFKSFYKRLITAGERKKKLQETLVNDENWLK
jgi:hypothetical protein